VSPVAPRVDVTLSMASCWHAVMITRGTRSAYNKGCRCDMCREASRLARARQREIARTRDAAESTDVGTAPPWVVVAGLAGAGVFCPWRGWRIKTEDPEARVTRRRWILAGVLLGGTAAGLAHLASRPDDLDECG
jgi:hypothetical protein